MDNITINSKLELEVFLIENLNYSIISEMSFKEYKNFVLLLFSEINQLKKEGLKQEEIFNFIQNLYSKEMSKDDSYSDILFERRFSAITEELVSFCADPMFWYTDDFDIFIKKWQLSFDSDWFKKV